MRTLLLQTYSLLFTTLNYRLRNFWNFWPVVFKPNLKYLHVKVSASFHGNWKIIVSNFKRMADRFPDCDAKEVEQFKENGENPNTGKH